MEIILISSILGLSALILLFIPRKASAHCDTMDGPTVKDGIKSLETGNVSYAAKWVMPDHDDELKEIFDLSIKVRGLNEDAKKVADRYFLENLVRIHRAGEGVAFTGIKPYGTPMDVKVAAADKAIEIGDLSPLEGLFTDEEMHDLEQKFEKAMALSDYDADDLKAAREWVEAYVIFFKTAEGHHHDHGHGHGH